MELTKTLVCCALVMIVMTEVVLTRPTSDSEHINEIETLVKDIDHRIKRSEKKSSRRRRRHIQTQQVALMDFCVRYPHRCRDEINKLNRNRRQQLRVVYVIDK